MAQLAPLDQDKMAEVAHICMSHSATSLNTLTGKVITVSPPSVKVVNSADIKNILMAFGMGSVTVQIDYKDDFHGNNLLMFKENDVKVVMDLMMGGPGIAAPGNAFVLRVRSDESDDGSFRDLSYGNDSQDGRYQPAEGDFGKHKGRCGQHRYSSVSRGSDGDYPFPL